MVKDMDLFFDPESEEYVIISEGHVLKVNKEDFQALKKSMNGISYALKLNYQRKMQGKLKL